MDRDSYFQSLYKYDSLNILAQGINDLNIEAQNYLEQRLRNAQADGRLSQANIVKAYRSAYRLSEDKEK